VYFEQPYYLVPDKDAAKPYQLLVDVMEQEQKVAIGRFVLRSRESLVAIRPLDGVLCLETMRYHDEVLAPDRDQPLPEAAGEPSAREIDMARQLVATLSTTFDPEKYRDEYREELLTLIDKKAAGEEIVTHEVPEEPGKVLDLMAALEASLARSGARQAAPRKAAPRKAVGNVAKKVAPTKRVKKATSAKAASAKAGQKPASAKPAERAPRSA
jgi:DNA end-binding protein Ku